MKLSTHSLGLPLLLAALPQGSSLSRSLTHLPECSDNNVTDADSCQVFCGVGHEGHFEVITDHADTVDDLHVDILVGFECHCDEIAAQTRSGAAGDDDDHNACWIGYESPFPTCESVGLGECNDDAAKTCDDYCLEISLLGHSADDSHVCAHREWGEDDCHDGHDHDRRALAEELSSHDDEEEHGFTLCFCGADSVGDGVMVCGDEGWKATGAHDSHEEGCEDESGAFQASAIASTALACLVVAAFL